MYYEAVSNYFKYIPIGTVSILAIVLLFAGIALVFVIIAYRWPKLNTNQQTPQGKCCHASIFGLYIVDVWGFLYYHY